MDKKPENPDSDLQYQLSESISEWLQCTAIVTHTDEGWFVSLNDLRSKDPVLRNSFNLLRAMTRDVPYSSHEKLLRIMRKVHGDSEDVVVSIKNAIKQGGRLRDTTTNRELSAEESRIHFENFLGEGDSEPPKSVQ
ncbi:hypothetical protein [Oceanospirillum sediminis]|uniref:Uncharacterized protein n=1 Tax=Oceanospirillum sediminis TaxID=2760088 RepID=A0A839IS44_9GAMM|nr:hypothetical protein [Oceanospirillum sediminis]MBB1487372.1 hypothetical protein [Oceanospirillum sediminis]